MPYGDELSNADDFYPNLVEAFTFDDELYCAPKDFSTLGLVINTDALGRRRTHRGRRPHRRGRSSSSVAESSPQGDRVGLAFGPEYQRVGAFFPQAGGAMVNEDGTEATVDSPENLEALDVRAGHDRRTASRRTPPTSARAGAARPSARSWPR